MATFVFGPVPAYWGCEERLACIERTGGADTLPSIYYSPRSLQHNQIRACSRVNICRHRASCDSVSVRIGICAVVEGLELHPKCCSYRPTEGIAAARRREKGRPRFACTRLSGAGTL